MKRGKILIIENDFKIARRIGKSLTAKGYQVFIANEGAGAIDAALQEQPDVLVHGPGLRARKQGRRVNGGKYSSTPIQFITGHTISMNYQRALDNTFSHLAFDGGHREPKLENLEPLPLSFDDPKQPESGQA